jgi:hypothetical protein
MKRIIAAIATAAVSVAIYPIMNRLAVAERGYDAFGGEEMLLVFGIFAALMILLDAKREPPADNGRLSTESEQSE